MHFLTTPEAGLGLGLMIGAGLTLLGAYTMRAELMRENRRLRRDNARLNNHPAADTEPTVDLDRDALLLGTSGIIVPSQRRGQ